MEGTEQRDMPFDLGDLYAAENYLGQGDAEGALPALLDLRDEAEAYIAQACVTTDQVQYFSFADAFERLAYRRVETDPRELRQAPAPFDRLYSDLGFAYIRLEEYALARDALMQAVRWDPMNCNYRLDLAELFRLLGNTQEWASLSHSVLERAADARSLGRAYANLGQFFLDEGNVAAAAGCVRLAKDRSAGERRTAQLVERMASEHPEADELTDAEAFAELERQGVPTSPNAEIAICLIMCATDAAAAGDANEATRLTIRARDLVGADAAKALIQLVRESDAELARERAAAGADDAADGAGAAAGAGAPGATAAASAPAGEEG